jgi:hypothetical protein
VIGNFSDYIKNLIILYGKITIIGKTFCIKNVYNRKKLNSNNGKLFKSFVTMDIHVGLNW